MQSVKTNNTSLISLYRLFNNKDIQKYRNTCKQKQT